MIGIIIATYNAEKTIDKCIKSILEQTYQKFHIYVINDGSTDNTLKKLKKYENNNKITIITQKNEGACSARNNGIRNLETPFFTFIDSDDYIKPNYLADLIEKQAEEDYDLVISNYQTLVKKVFSISNQKEDRIFILSEESFVKTIYDLITYYNSDGICSKLYKTEIGKKITMKNLQIGEDLLFNIQYLFYSKKIAYINRANYIYVIQKNSLMRKPCYQLLKQLDDVAYEIENKIIRTVYVYRVYMEYVRNMYYNNIKYTHSNIPEKVKKILIYDVTCLKELLAKKKYIYYKLISKLVKYNNNFLFNKINNLKFKLRKKND